MKETLNSVPWSLFSSRVPRICPGSEVTISIPGSIDERGARKDGERGLQRGLLPPALIP